MANISPIDVKKTSRVRIVQWENVTESDTPLKLETEGFADRTVQVSGTFGGETVTIQGSNDDVNYINLTDHLGVDLAFSSGNGIALIAQSPRYIKPVVAGAGTSTDLDITLVANTVGV